MKKFKIPELAFMISTLLVSIFLTTFNIANANSNDLQNNPVPFLPPFQHSQSQLHPVPQQQPQHPQHINQQPPEKQPLNSNDLSNDHKNQFNNHSPTVISIMPF